MSNFAKTAVPTDTAGASAQPTTLREDIQANWSEFSDIEIAALTGKDDLVTKVSAKYGLDQAQAQKNVEAVLAGRTI